MPVHYTEESAGPSTRAQEQDVYVEEDSSDYRSMTKAELSAELEKRGLAKSGSKAELIARLQDG